MASSTGLAAFGGYRHVHAALGRRYVAVAMEHRCVWHHQPRRRILPELGFRYGDDEPLLHAYVAETKPPARIQQLQIAARHHYVLSRRYDILGGIDAAHHVYVGARRLHLVLRRGRLYVVPQAL